MNDPWAERLSQYLDDELSLGERQALEAHLLECVECATTLDEIKRVVLRAQALEDHDPEDNLWPGVAARIGAGRAPARLQPVPAGRRFSFTLPQLVAASLLLMLLSGGTVWLLRNRPAAPPGAASTQASDATPAESPAVDVTPANFADAQYNAAIADLESALGRGRGRLDPRTIEILEKNLAIIDQAIEQARQALAADPANIYLNSHLVDARRRKLELLRRATALASEAN